MGRSAEQEYATELQKELFLATFAKDYDRRAACRAAGVGFSTVNWWIDHDSDFKAKWDDIQHDLLATMEKEIDRRGRDGINKPVIYKGQIMKDDEGAALVVKEYSDALLMFRTKKLDPTYREGFDAKLQGKITVEHVHDR